MANKNYLDKSGLSYFWGKIKTALNGKANTGDIPTKTSDLTNDSGFVTSEVSISTTTPSEDYEIWINPNESVNVYGNYISNSYGTSQEIGYSQEYVNTHPPVKYISHSINQTLTAGFNTKVMGNYATGMTGYTLVGFQPMVNGFADQLVCSYSIYANSIYMSCYCQINTTTTFRFYEVWVRDDLISNS